MAGGGVMKRRVAGQPQASGRAGHPGLPAQPLRAWRLRRRPERPRNWARWSSRRGCASSSRTPRACWRTSPTTIAAAASPSPMSGSSCSRCTRLAAQRPLELADLGVGAAPTLSALTSQSLSASAYKLPEVREELFQLLYKQIEQAALEAGLASIGVPFIDAVTPATDMAVVPTPSAPTEPQPTSTYVVRQCAIVPTRGSPPLPSNGLKEVPARVLYATLCAPASIEACKRDVEKLVRQENSSPAALARPIIWRTRPALTTDDSAANLVASMSDARLRLLKDGTSELQVPNDLVVQSAELASTGPLNATVVRGWVGPWRVPPRRAIQSLERRRFRVMKPMTAALDVYNFTTNNTVPVAGALRLHGSPATGSASTASRSTPWPKPGSLLLLSAGAVLAASQATVGRSRTRNWSSPRVSG